MKITVLTDVESNDRKTHDDVVPQVARALRKNGHKVSVFGVHGDVKHLVNGLLRRKPDLVFNLVESFGKDLHGDIDVAGLLELMNLKYTGSGPGELYLRQDKGLAKKLLSFDQILYPDFAIFSQDSDLETGGSLRMPMFVKPLRADASIGIDNNALVQDARALMERVLMIHKKFNDSALVEQYVDGREFYVSILGNREATALPPIEMDFSGLPEGAPKILDSKAKWDERSKQYKGTKAVVADLPNELRAKLIKISMDAYRALRVRDYGRVDLRLTNTNEIYVIEVNANCYLEKSTEFVMAAKAAGIEYKDLINKIADHAMERYK